jgi:ELWxxDGT repeat protein
MTQNTMPEATWTTRGPQQLTAVGQYLYFVAGDNIRGIELCRSDGTFGGTVMVQDLNPGYPGALYHGGVYLKGVTTIAALGDTAIFGANDGVHGWEPWKAHYDGEPVADAGDGYQVLEGQSITLSGARSRPGARPIVSYEWDLDFNFAADGDDPTVRLHSDAGVGVRAGIDDDARISERRVRHADP